MNVLFAVWAMYAVYECMASTSLNDFFLNSKSFVFTIDFYDVYSIVDGAKNLFVMGITCVAALCRLRAVGSYARTVHNIAIVRQVMELREKATAHQNKHYFAAVPGPRRAHHPRRLHRRSHRPTCPPQIRILVNALLLCCLCFFLRMVMIALKLVALSNDGDDDPDHRYVGYLQVSPYPQRTQNQTEFNRTEHRNRYHLPNRAALRRMLDDYVGFYTENRPTHRLPQGVHEARKVSPWLWLFEQRR